MTLPTILNQLHFELTSFIRQYPHLFFPLMRLNKRLRRIQGALLVTKQTEVVIEGFLRTGNTFAALAFMSCQVHEVIIANHTHAPATIIRAAKLGVPTLVLIREPRETILSLKLKHPHISLCQGFREYIRYYSTIRPYKSSYMLAPFEDITSNFGLVIKRFNHRFGTRFTPFEHTEENVQRVFAHIERIDNLSEKAVKTRFSIPLVEKEESKNKLRPELDRETLRPWIMGAEKIYHEYVESLPSNSSN